MKSGEDRTSPRPAIPLLLFCALSYWACGAVTLLVLSSHSGLRGYVLASSLVALGIAAVLLVRGSPYPAPLLIVLFGLLGIGLQCAYSFAYDAAVDRAMTYSGEDVTCQVVEDPSFGEREASVVVRVVEADPVLPLTAAPCIRVVFDGDPPLFGQEFKARIVLSDPKPDTKARLQRQGIVAYGRVSDVETLEPSVFGLLAHERARYCERVDESLTRMGFEDEPRSLLKAVVVGERSDLFASPLYHEVKVVGLAHIVAVSGAHLVMVSAGIHFLLRGLGVRGRRANAIVGFFLIVYVVMVGFPVSCLRAAIMTGCSLAAQSLRRRAHASSSLGLSIVLLVTLDPACSLSLSFALSAASVLGILLLMPLFASWVSCRSERLRGFIVDPACMTVAALVITLPFSVASFAQVSLVSPISNVATSPLVMVLCMGGILSFFCMPSGLLFDAALFVLGSVARLFCTLVDACFALPFACIPVTGFTPLIALACFSLVAALWVSWPRKPPRVALGIVFASVVFSLAIRFVPAPDRVIMLDVGQGDAFLVQSGGESLLIDTGNQPSRLYASLARMGVARLDAVLITHADDDHCACLADLRGMVGCKQVIVAEGMTSAEGEAERELIGEAKAYVGDADVIEVGKGDVFSVGSFTFTVISPDTPIKVSGNEESLCLLGEYPARNGDAHSYSMLFCGDAEAEVLSALVDQGALGKIDLFKVGHHGARASLDEDLVEALDPALALVSVGAGNTYGHPNEETISLLEGEGARVFRSDMSGDVECRFVDDGIEVKTMR